MPAKIVPVSGESLREAAKRKMKQRSEERYLPTDPDERLYALGELLEMDFKEFNKRELDQLHGFLRFFSRCIERSWQTTRERAITF